MPPLPGSPKWQSLLLIKLPPPPPLTSPDIIATYYLPAIQHFFTNNTTELTTTSATIALLAPPTFTPTTPRAAIVDHAQRLLCGVYSAVARVAADRLAASAEADTGGSEGDGDPAVVFYLDAPEEESTSSGWEFGPVFTLSWILQQEWKTKLEIGPESATGRRPSPPPGEIADAKRHSVVAVGGTFDHLHAGHKLLLTTTAFMVDPPSLLSSIESREVIIGLTGPALLRNKSHAALLSSWPVRAHDTLNFLLRVLTLAPANSTAPSRAPVQANVVLQTKAAPTTPDPTTTLTAILGPSTPAAAAAGQDSLTLSIVEIHEPLGPTATNGAITALVVSEETASGGNLVNDARVERGLQVLDVVVVGVVGEGGRGDGAKMSSTERRRRRVVGEVKGRI